MTNSIRDDVAIDSVAGLFEAQVERAPDAVALWYEGRRVTYRELNGRANQLARRLRRRGVGPEARVALLVEHPPDMVSASLAVAKAGGASVALDPAWPDARIAAVLDDCGAGVLLRSAGTSSVPARFAGEVIALGGDDARLRAESTDDLGLVAMPEQLFSVVYTSGSTGRPKGVLVPLRSVLNRLVWMWTAHPYRPGDASLLYRSQSIIGFTWDCFGPLLKGVPVVLARAASVRDPADLVAVSTRNHVSHVSASPGRWHAVIEYLERHPTGWRSLRLARSSGEPLRPAIVERWRALFPGVPLLNVYGGTECSSSTAYDTSAFAPAGDTRVPVGTPVPNVDVHVLDDRLQPVPPGETGEVCIAGACLARGYLGLPALTAERFVANPLGSRPGERLLRTGDMGVRRPDGTLEIAGRRDHQVKVRGFRVELAEVAAGLERCAGVRECVVVPGDAGAGDTRLVAYVVAEDESFVSAGYLRSLLLNELPDYMVPATFVGLDEMPRTPSGKIDRSRLPGPDADAGAGLSESSLPSTPEEQALAEIWRRVLGIERIGIDDNFFELGGHSLVAMEIVSGILDRFGVDMALDALFTRPTIRSLADAISGPE